MNEQRAAVCAGAAVDPGRGQFARARLSVGRRQRLASWSSARGAYVTDVDGVEYVDLVASWGPAILGHAHPEVVAAVQAAAARGLSFGASTPGETELAELVRGRVTNVVATRGRAGAGADREDPTGLDGHRGDDDGHPARSRLHRTRPAGEIRGSLPRPLRRPARRSRLRCRDARHAGFRRESPPRRPRRPWSSPTTISMPCARSSRGTRIASPR